ncbi:nucleotidyltransferase family protein [Candidatus Woesearchaeota archaeon]|nr:nucleotidyltransferase family protein [Candidatus Woesearchaeota archaeon]
MYPLTENQPKPLLKVAGIPIVEHILKKLEKLDTINEIIIVTNNKFYGHFMVWLNDYSCSKNVKVINDGTISNEGRLGAVGDINYILKNQEINDDLLVIAGDNLFGFEINNFLNHFQQKNSSLVALHDLKDKNLVKNKFGVAILCDQLSKVVDFEEKPAEPKSTLAATACYIFHKEDLKLVEVAVETGKADDPGDLVKYLVKESEVHGFVFDQHWFDIGSIEGLKQAEEVYRKL